jgi:hypothetical protein
MSRWCRACTRKHGSKGSDFIFWLSTLTTERSLFNVFYLLSTEFLWKDDFCRNCKTWLGSSWYTSKTSKGLWAAKEVEFTRRTRRRGRLLVLIKFQINKAVKETVMEEKVSSYFSVCLRPSWEFHLREVCLKLYWSFMLRIILTH